MSRKPSLLATAIKTAEQPVSAPEAPPEPQDIAPSPQPPVLMARRAGGHARRNDAQPGEWAYVGAGKPTPTFF